MRGLSQQKLADALGLKRNNIASYEAGIVEPRALTFIQIAEFFHVSPDDLLLRELSANPKMVAQILRSIIPEEKLRQNAGVRHHLQLLEEQTTNMEQLIEGFWEFYRSRRQLNDHSTDETVDFASNFTQLFEMLSDLLRSNRDFIQSQDGKQG